MSTEALNQRFLYIPRSALYASLALHLAVLMAVVVNGVLEHYHIHLFGKKPPVREMYQDFIQVDVVALPQALVKDMPKADVTQPIVDKPAKTIEEPAKPATAPDHTTMVIQEKARMEATKKAEALKKKEAEKERRTKEKKAAEARDKALKKLKDEAGREAALKALSEKRGKAGRQKIAGNILSKGTSTTGNIGNAKDKYGALVQARIREHFNIYAWQKKKGLVAVVHFELYPTGRVRQRVIQKRSIDPLYDSAVLEAIDQAQPFPAPDDPAVLDGGFTVEFRPE